MQYLLDVDLIRTHFERITGKPVVLIITDNATSLISVRKLGGALNVRLHRIFLQAKRDVLDEIGLFLKHRRGKTPLIRGFIKDHRNELPERKPRKQKLKTEGQYYDLKAIFLKLNKDYFGNSVSASITWGKKRKRNTRYRTLGTYSIHTNTIHINPALDRSTVPRYVVEHVIHHEMLHAYLGTPLKNGRRTLHSGEFRRKEKLFADYEKAAAWCC